MSKAPIPGDDVDSDGEDRARLDSLASTIGQDGGSAGTRMLETILSGLPPRWRNWVIRGVFTWLMIGGFALLISGGPLALMLTTLAVQVRAHSPRQRRPAMS